MPRALKVFRTPIGFHDAYVAAPSQKAAMEAWGSGTDLFARGEAELVTDPVLTAEPLASPGVVVKRLRGTVAEQIAALKAQDEVAQPRRGGKKPAGPQVAKTAPRARKKPIPPPTRTSLDAAEKALAAATGRQAEEMKALAEREAELARERRALQKAQETETARLTRKRNEEKTRFEEAMRLRRREA